MRQLLGVVTGPGTGDVRWKGVTRATRTVQGDTHGELISNMHAAACDIWRSSGETRALHFEIIEGDDDGKSVTATTDPNLVDRVRLQQRRAAGEHLCFFCGHETICAIQTPVRAHPQTLVVISGCAQFKHVEIK